MDPSWMEANRLSAEYINKVVEFLQFGKRNLLDNNGFFIVFVFVVRIQKNMERKKYLNDLCYD